MTANDAIKIFVDEMKASFHGDGIHSGNDGERTADERQPTDPEFGDEHLQRAIARLLFAVNAAQEQKMGARLRTGKTMSVDQFTV